jgi:hypothetical protein
VQDVIQAALEQIDDVLIVQAVINLAALFAGTHEAHLPQAAQLMRNG